MVHLDLKYVDIRDIPDTGVSNSMADINQGLMVLLSVPPVFVEA